MPLGGTAETVGRTGERGSNTEETGGRRNVRETKLGTMGESGSQDAADPP